MWTTIKPYQPKPAEVERNYQIDLANENLLKRMVAIVNRKNKYKAKPINKNDGHRRFSIPHKRNEDGVEESPDQKRMRRTTDDRASLKQSSTIQVL